MSVLFLQYCRHVKSACRIQGTTRKGKMMQSNVEQYERRRKADPFARLAMYQKTFSERAAKKEKAPVMASKEGRK